MGSIGVAYEKAVARDIGEGGGEGSAGEGELAEVANEHDGGHVDDVLQHAAGDDRPRQPHQPLRLRRRRLALQRRRREQRLMDGRVTVHRSIGPGGSRSAPLALAGCAERRPPGRPDKKDRVLWGGVRSVTRMTRHIRRDRFRSCFCFRLLGLNSARLRSTTDRTDGWGQISYKSLQSRVITC